MAQIVCLPRRNHDKSWDKTKSPFDGLEILKASLYLCVCKSSATYPISCVRRSKTPTAASTKQWCRRIVEEAQQGESKAAYGKGVIKNLSEALQQEFGKGFSERNLENMRAFCLGYPIWGSPEKIVCMPFQWFGSFQK